MHVFVLADPSRCIGCRACEIACVAAHTDKDMSQAMEQNLPFTPRLTIIRASGVTTPIQCRQCEDAPCAAACPNGAIFSNGRSVTVDVSRCCGCKACLAVCPVGAIDMVPAAYKNETVVAHKCDLCAENADTPACVTVCPANALRIVTQEVLKQTSGSRRRRSASQLAREDHYR